MSDLFNNREIATGIWLIFLIFPVMMNESFRNSFARVLKSFLRMKIVISILLMGLYVGLGLLLLYRLGLWDASLLKDSIYWFLFTGFVLFMNLMTGNDYAIFFRKTIIGCFKVIVFIQFLLNFYTLPLFIELLLVPVLIFLLVASEYTNNKLEYAVVKKFFDVILAIIGLAVAVFVAKSVYKYYSGLFTTQVFLSVLLPIWLTFLFLPFLYIAKLISDYEMLFIRLSYFVKKDVGLVAYVKKRIIFLCHFNLKKLNQFSKDKLSCLSSIDTKKAADEMFKDFKLGVACNAKKRE